MFHPWANEAVFYHIYPLGWCGAPGRNDFHSQPLPRLEKLYGWLDHIQGLGASALYLGPLFESTAHGYDTADYYHIDRRLGTRETLRALASEIHLRGMRLVLDGVFNHVGRDFWAFRDLQQNLQRSPYAGWFEDIDFGGRSPFDDPFRYQGWAGHFDLVKLNLHNPQVREHLFGAVELWVQEFAIDGLRLDAADVVDADFLAALAAHSRALRPDFWLMGEMVHGDYRQLAGPAMLDSTTNYEGYKSLYSSFVDRNFFELAYALNRQFGPQGIYRELTLYSFADNHDVDRVASSLQNPAHLYPLYALLFSMPGIPSVYYGSEWGLAGRRNPHSDLELRPQLELAQASSLPQADLPAWIARLAGLRQASAALRRGDYQQLHVAHQQFAFLRSHAGQQVLIAVNAAPEPAALTLRLPGRGGWLVDLLHAGDRLRVDDHQVTLNLPPCGAGLWELQAGNTV